MSPGSLPTISPGAALLAPMVLVLIGASDLARWIFWAWLAVTVVVIGLYAAQHDLSRSRRQS